MLVKLDHVLWRKCFFFFFGPSDVELPEHNLRRVALLFPSSLRGANSYGNMTEAKRTAMEEAKKREETVDRAKGE